MRRKHLGGTLAALAICVAAYGAAQAREPVKVEVKKWRVIGATKYSPKPRPVSRWYKIKSNAKERMDEFKKSHSPNGLLAADPLISADFEEKTEFEIRTPPDPKTPRKDNNVSRSDKRPGEKNTRSKENPRVIIVRVYKIVERKINGKRVGKVVELKEKRLVTQDEEAARTFYEYWKKRSGYTASWNAPGRKSPVRKPQSSNGSETRSSALQKSKLTLTLQNVAGEWGYRSGRRMRRQFTIQPDGSVKAYGYYSYGGKGRAEIKNGKLMIVAKGTWGYVKDKPYLWWYLTLKDGRLVGKTAYTRRDFTKSNPRLEWSKPNSAILYRIPKK